MLINKHISFRILSIIAIALTISVFPFKGNCQEYKSEKELQKAAESFFKEKNYINAFPLFSQLLSLYPTDPNYNYKFSVSMLFADADKTKALPYLLKSAKTPNTDKKIFFYLGKGYHLNYKFAEAITPYKKFKNLGSEKDVIELEVDRNIQMCLNGAELIKKKTKIDPISKTDIKEEEAFRSYDMITIGGKLLVKPDDFKAKADKSMGESSILYLGKGANELVYSSYGEKGNNKDIYKVIRRIDGSWSSPVLLSDNINTDFDEDFPVMRPNSKVLYFCSKGHNSVGGYDIFKSVLDSKTDTWSKPVNLGFDINSPADDILYVFKEDEKTSYFSSNRASIDGMTTVYLITLDEIPGIPEPIIAKVEEEQEDKGYKEQSVRVFTGEYDTTGLAAEERALKYVRDNQDNKSKTKSKNKKPGNENNTTYSETQEDDSAYDGDFVYKEVKGTPSNSKTNKDNKATSNSKSLPKKEITDFTDDEIINTANEYAQKIESEQKSLSKEAEVAFSLASKKKSSAENKSKEANEIFVKANNIKDEKQKKLALGQANKLKAEAEKADKEASIAFEMSKSLATDAENKKRESDKAAENARKIEESIQNNQKDESIALLIEQKVMADGDNIEKQGANKISNSKQIEAKNKESKATESFEKIQFMENEVAEIKDEITLLEKQANEIEDPVAKDELNKQAEELVSELTATQNELETTYKDAKRYEGEAKTLRKEADLMERVSNEITADASEQIKKETENNSVKSSSTTNDQRKSASETAAVEKEISNATFEFTSIQEQSTSFTKQINNLKKEGFDISDLNSKTNRIATLEKQINNAITNKDPEIANEKLNEIEPLLTELEKEIATVKAIVSNKKVETKLNELQTSKETYSVNLTALSDSVEYMKSQGYDVLGLTTKMKEIQKLNKELQQALESKDITLANQKSESIKTTFIELDNDLEKVNSKAAAAAEELAKIENESQLRIIKGEYDDFSGDFTNYQESLQKYKDNGFELENLAASIEAVDKLNQEVQDALKTENLELASDKLDLLKIEKEKIEESLALIEEQEIASNETSDNKSNLEETNRSNDSKIENEITTNKNNQESTVNGENSASNNVNTSGKLTDNQSNSNDSIESDEVIASNESNENEQSLNNSNKASSSTINTKAEIDSKFDEFEISNDFEENAKQINTINIKQTVIGKKELANIEAINSEAESLFNESEKLRLEAKDISDPKKKKEEIEKADQLAEEALSNQKSAINQYNFQVTHQQLIDQKDIAEQLSDEDAERAISLTESADDLFNQAQTLRREATKTDDPVTKKKDLEKAQALEKLAVEQKKTTINLYTYQSNQLALAEIETSANELSDDDKKLIEETEKEYNNLFEESKSIREKAEKIKDPLKRSEAFEKANQKEELGLEKQKQTVRTLTLKTTRSTELAIAKTSKEDDINNEFTIAEEENKDETNEKRYVNIEPVFTKEVSSSNNENTSASYQNENLSSEELEELSTKQQEEAKVLYERIESISDPDEMKEALATAQGLEQEAINNATLAKEKENTAKPEDSKTQKESAGVLSPGVEVNNISDSQKQTSDQVITDVMAEEAAILQQKKQEEAQAAEAAQLAEKKKQEEAQAAEAAQLAEKKTQEEAQAAQAAQLAEKKTQEEVQAAQAAQLAEKKKQEEAQAAEAAQLAEKKTQEEAQAAQAAQLAEKKTQEEVQATALKNSMDKDDSDKRYVNVEPVFSENTDSNTDNNTSSKSNVSTNNKDIAGTDNYSLPVKAKKLFKDVFSLLNISAKSEVEKNISNYSKANPIPVDVSIPTGLVYKVQIGAFRKPIPQNLFKGINPLMGENTPMGFIRYSAGMFQLLNSATKARDQIRKLGYKDAFVVAYYNGKRVSHSTANAMISSGEIKVASSDPYDMSNSKNLLYSVQVGVFSKESDLEERYGLGQLYTNTTSNGAIKYLYGKHDSYATAQSAKEVAINKGINDAFIVAFNNGIPVNTTKARSMSGETGSTSSSTKNADPNDISNIKEMFYTVQVGAYAKPTDLNKKYGLNKLYTKRNSQGTIKYCYGKFDSYEKAAASKSIAINQGVADAFVTAYFNGKRITIAQAKTIEVTKTDQPKAQTKGKYTVKIGEYETNLPVDEAKTFFDFKDMGIERIESNGKIVYTVGNYDTEEEAANAKTKVVNKGKKDAIVVVNQNGNILSVKEYKQQ